MVGRAVQDACADVIRQLVKIAAGLLVTGTAVAASPQQLTIVASDAVMRAFEQFDEFQFIPCFFRAGGLKPCLLQDLHGVSMPV